MLRHLAAAAVIGLLVPRGGEAQGASIFSLLPTDDRVLSIGSEGSSALSSADLRGAYDEPLEAWAFEGKAGDAVTIDLISADFDGTLYVSGPGLSETLADYDSGAGCDARLDVTLLESGTFTVVASSAGSFDTGVYRIRVSSDPEPIDDFPCGGVNPTALLNLPVVGQLGSGAPTPGSLDGSDASLPDGKRADAWTIMAEEGQELTIRLLSDDFDAYLYVVGPGMEVMEDDDGAGNLNSQLTVRFPMTGAYRVIATSYSEGDRGTYTLELGRATGIDELPIEDRIELGETVEGFLPYDLPIAIDDRPAQVWEFSGVAGQEVTIELRSEDFDAYLYLIGPGISVESPLSDDDSAGSLDSRIETTLRESGVYRIIVSSYSSGVGGQFELEVLPE